MQSSLWKFAGYYDEDILVELAISEEIVFTHWIEEAALNACMPDPLAGI
jgi:hypothetical protein